MITLQADSGQPPPWQSELAGSIREPSELLELLALDPALLPGAIKAARHFPLRVTRSFVSRMASGDPADPLLRQVLPLHLELDEHPEFTPDPVGDRRAIGTPGVMQKYAGRALLIASGACAINCRYCFRREFPYSGNMAAQDAWAAALAAIRDDLSITEVILSGGDPLVQRDDKLSILVDALAAIPQVRNLRIHTRLPVVLPSRIDQRLLNWVAASPLPVVFVIHANHANEFGPEVVAACARLRAAGVTIFLQSVLLRGVNDSEDTIAELSRTAFKAGVIPYYLHMLDKVRGAAHFDIATERAVEIHRRAAAILPGYLVPRLVREIAGAAYKMPVQATEASNLLTRVAEHTA